MNCAAASSQAKQILVQNVCVFVYLFVNAFQTLEKTAGALI